MSVLKDLRACLKIIHAAVSWGFRWLRQRLKWVFLALENLAQPRDEIIFKQALKSALFEISPLRVYDASYSNCSCKICGGGAQDFDLVDANKYCTENNPYSFGICGVGIRYLKCDDCGFIFTKDYDSWSSDDFARYIYNEDYIKIDGEYVEVRPKQTAEMLSARIPTFKSIRILDYGSGNGVFALEMSRRSYPFVESYDPFSNPVRPIEKFDFITCNEVLEHCVDPIETLNDIASFLSPSGVILLGTSIQPHNIDSLRGRWWYIGPRNGHISIFSLAALNEAAVRVGLCLWLGRHNELLLSWPNREENANALLDVLAVGVRNKYLRIQLFAPDESGNCGPGIACVNYNTWHGVEQSSEGVKFRWTKEQMLEWDVELKGHARLEIECNLLNSISLDHSTGSKLWLNGVLLDTEAASRKLVATSIVEGDRNRKSFRIALKTPSPVRPSNLGRSHDERPLGVAVPIFQPLQSHDCDR